VAKAETVKGIKEYQPSWLDMLKEEIKNHVSCRQATFDGMILDILDFISICVDLLKLFSKTF
jgi:hypothetical protein